MKIRQPWLISTLGLIGSWLVQFWIGSLRYRFRHHGPNVMPIVRGLRQHYIYAFWHEYIPLMAYHFGRPTVRVLVSEHADGQLITDLVRHFRYRFVRGSSTRGAVKAVRTMLRSTQASHLAITPDGPRGPRREVQPGLIYLASRTGLPIVPMGVGFRSPWRLKSWDQFAIPVPWSASSCVQGRPIVVPADADQEQLEEYRRLVEGTLHAVTSEAEKLAERL